MSGRSGQRDHHARGYEGVYPDMTSANRAKGLLTSVRKYATVLAPCNSCNINTWLSYARSLILPLRGLVAHRKHVCQVQSINSAPVERMLWPGLDLWRNDVPTKSLWGIFLKAWYPEKTPRIGYIPPEKLGLKLETSLSSTLSIFQAWKSRVT